MSLIQLNNPGGITKGPFVYVGEKTHSSDETYREFYEMNYGIRAIFKQINIFVQVGNNTIQAICNLWEGETQENVQAMLDFMTEELKVDLLTKITVNDNSLLKNFASAIYEYFTGEEATTESIAEGLDLLIGNKIL